jgi:hypothetical protein
MPPQQSKTMASNKSNRVTSANSSRTASTKNKGQRHSNAPRQQTVSATPSLKPKSNSTKSKPKSNKQQPQLKKGRADTSSAKTQQKPAATQHKPAANNNKANSIKAMPKQEQQQQKPKPATAPDNQPPTARFVSVALRRLRQLFEEELKKRKAVTALLEYQRNDTVPPSMRDGTKLSLPQSATTAADISDVKSAVKAAETTRLQIAIKTRKSEHATIVNELNSHRNTLFIQLTDFYKAITSLPNIILSPFETEIDVDQPANNITAPLAASLASCPAPISLDEMTNAAITSAMRKYDQGHFDILTSESLRRQQLEELEQKKRNAALIAAESVSTKVAPTIGAQIAELQKALADSQRDYAQVKTLLHLQSLQLQQTSKSAKSTTAKSTSAPPASVPFAIASAPATDLTTSTVAPFDISRTLSNMSTTSTVATAEVISVLDDDVQTSQTKKSTQQQPITNLAKNYEGGSNPRQAGVAATQTLGNARSEALLSAIQRAQSLRSHDKLPKNDA